ncbi:MAG TPA: aldo/keto reductase [Pseudonocardiaceae bacterium]|jgi:aryl-alcohol dehydrogenase-like predicted oxidoreductase|nr:aldo/keto reductase [Pseudonocardiaceae bacterium]
MSAAERKPSIGRLGVGLAAIGRPAYINVGRSEELGVHRSVDELRAVSWAVLDEAYAAGVRWVDAARSYGRAEEFLAGWLADRCHSDVAVSSKWGYAYVGDWRLDAPVHEVKEHSLARFTSQLAETRALLGNRLGLYQVHSLTAGSPLFGDRKLQEALVRLAEHGVRIGFSTSGPAQADTVRRALDLTAQGQPVFTAVQSTWNLLETSVGPALAQAHAGGALVMVKEAMANGRLAVQAPEAVGKLAAGHQVGPDAIALATALAQPWADVVLLGSAGPDQLRSNLSATGVHLESTELDELRSLAETPTDYWAERAALPWT